MIGGDFGMWVEYKQCELYDLAGSGCSGQSLYYVVYKIGDVFGEGVIGGGLWFVGE